ncbi:Protein REVERSION-TO-ETHYLENE SENSITIVITY1 [Capsicum baccatum]|uniref:Protein REVERSION-TO-ETHYLENE SENSITIVITY1 n=1 Tax=Capsicum baccatum TaxID=33114 RepID=A0A2G2W5I7_CAPBA|nr:Protein REVERSION-TO-ETHYLENE SENSITIVITY1 [Capsicum baccatum]
MPTGALSLIDLEPAYKMESIRAVQDIQHEFWPLDEIDPENAKFPCCLVWTPLPVVSWLAPFIGHVGICTEDGSAVAFSGSNFINVDDFVLGSVAKYLQLDRKQCCFLRNLAGHTCKHGYKHSEFGSATTWDDAIQSSVRHFEHKSYNLFTCNGYSFLANCLNRLCFGGSMDWNMINVGVLLLFKGHWVNNISILRSFSPFILVVCFGIFMVGWPFLVALLSFSLLLLAWFVFGTYCLKNLFDS